MSKIKDLKKEAIAIVKALSFPTDIVNEIKSLQVDKTTPIHLQRATINSYVVRKTNSLGGESLIARNFLLHGGTPEDWVSSFENYVAPQILRGLKGVSNDG